MDVRIIYTNIGVSLHTVSTLLQSRLPLKDAVAIDPKVKLRFVDKLKSLTNIFDKEKTRQKLLVQPKGFIVYIRAGLKEVCRSSTNQPFRFADSSLTSGRKLSQFRFSNFESRNTVCHVPYLNSSEEVN